MPTRGDLRRRAQRGRRRAAAGRCPPRPDGARHPLHRRDRGTRARRSRRGDPGSGRAAAGEPDVGDPIRFSPGSLITVTGTPSPCTRRGRPRRSQTERRAGRVEMSTSSNSPSASASRTASNGSRAVTRPSTFAVRSPVGPRAARSRAASASFSAQSFGASGTSSVNAVGRSSAHRSTSARRSGVDAVRLATTSVWCTRRHSHRHNRRSSASAG